LILGLALLLCACGPERHLDILTESLYDGRVGQAYADTVWTDNGEGRMTLRVLDGQLPPGIGFRSEHDFAVLDGTPTLEGQYLFTVEARDQLEDSVSWGGETVSQGFVLTIAP
jgi:hypothetical protein